MHITPATRPAATACQNQLTCFGCLHFRLQSHVHEASYIIYMSIGMDSRCMGIIWERCPHTWAHVHPQKSVEARGSVSLGLDSLPILPFIIVLILSLRHIFSATT